MRLAFRLAFHLCLGLGLGFAINRMFSSVPDVLPDKVVQPPPDSGMALGSLTPPFDPGAISDEIAGLAGAADRPRARLLLEQRLLTQAQRDGRSGLGRLIHAIDTPDGQGSTELEGFLFFLLRRIADKDPAAALDHVQNLVNARLRDSSFAMIAGVWAERDPRSFLKYAEGSPPGIARSRGTHMAIDHLAKSDPRGALDYVLASDGFVFELNAFGNVFKNWFRTDPGTAERWLLHDGSANDRKRLQAGAIHAYAEIDPAGAVDFIGRLPADQNPEFWLRQVIGNWAANDPAAALDRILEMPPEHVSESLLYKFSQRVSWNSPESVFAFAASLDLTDPQANAAYLAGAINREVFPEIREAAALATELPEGKWRREAFDNIISRWFDRDEVAASRWLGSLPPSPSRDIAVWRFVSELAPIDPERAASWALSVNDPRRRKRSIDDVLRPWRAADPAAAEAWEVENVLSSEAGGKN